MRFSPRSRTNFAIWSVTLLTSVLLGIGIVLLLSPPSQIRSRRVGPTGLPAQTTSNRTDSKDVNTAPSSPTTAATSVPMAGAALTATVGPVVRATPSSIVESTAGPETRTTAIPTLEPSAAPTSNSAITSTTASSAAPEVQPTSGSLDLYVAIRPTSCAWDAARVAGCRHPSRLARGGVPAAARGAPRACRPIQTGSGCGSTPRRPLQSRQ